MGQRLSRGPCGSLCGLAVVLGREEVEGHGRKKRLRRGPAQYSRGGARRLAWQSAGPAAVRRGTLLTGACETAVWGSPPRLLRTVGFVCHRRP